MQIFISFLLNKRIATRQETKTNIPFLKQQVNINNIIIDQFLASNRSDTELSNKHINLQTLCNDTNSPFLIKVNAHRNTIFNYEQ